MTDYFKYERAAIESLKAEVEANNISADMLKHMWHEAEGILNASNDQSMQWREALYNLAARIGISTEKLIEILCGM